MTRCGLENVRDWGRCKCFERRGSALCDGRQHLRGRGWRRCEQLGCLCDCGTLELGWVVSTTTIVALVELIARKLGFAQTLVHLVVHNTQPVTCAFPRAHLGRKLANELLKVARTLPARIQLRKRIEEASKRFRFLLCRLFGKT